jgi:hypothetical protein
MPDMNKRLVSGALALALAVAGPAKAQYAGIGADSGATGQVGVQTTATQIVAARTGGPRVGRVAVTITNNTGSDRLCIGFTNAVTTTTGECLPPIAGTSITLPTTSAIYGVVPVTTQTVSFLELF